VTQVHGGRHAATFPFTPRTATERPTAVDQPDRQNTDRLRRDFDADKIGEAVLAATSRRIGDMTTTQKHHILIIMAMILAIGIFFVGGRWVSSGFPIGIACGSCETSLDGRRIFASSDHLLTKLGLRTNSTSSILDVEGRHIEVKGDNATIDKTTKVSLPTGCKSIEFVVKAVVLTIWVDGQPIQRLRR
jgi:hypothetical protein